MEQFNVTGMSCAACQARVEKAVGKVDGVKECAVSLLTNSMSVDGTASTESIIKAVEEAGYGASLKGNKDNKTINIQDELEALEDKDTPKIIRRLVVSIILVLILMYFSMGHMMLGWPIPNWFDQNYVAMGLVQLLLAASVMIINQKFFINGFKGLIHKAPNMDSLVALGSSASFIYSTWMLFLMTDAVKNADFDLSKHYMHDLYFESAAMILALITVGKMLESRSKGKTTDALKGLMRLAPKTAVVERNGEERTIPVEEAKVDDIFIVKPGESISLDGVVVEGNGAVDESALTGESIPVDKEEGDEVSAATINMNGYMKCRATRVGTDTTLSQIIKLVSDTAATKAPIAKTADKVAGIFVPVVIGIAIVTFIIWMLVGAEFGYSLSRAIAVLVISCPCALGLATPVAIMVGSGMGAKNGILYKNASALEYAGRTQIVALDKTGTITTGNPVVTDIIVCGDISENELLQLAYSLELKSEHPLAKAVVQYGNENGINAKDVKDFKVLAGNGLTGSIEEGKVYGGSVKYITKLINADRIDIDIEKETENISVQGKTPLVFALDKGDGNIKPIGIVAVADQLKEDAVLAVKELTGQGIPVVMLTGDNEKTAQAIGKKAGVTQVISEVLPSDKANIVQQLRKKGKVVMVGDGINDAPALTAADIGMAIGAGTDVAIDAADIVLMKDGLRAVPAAIRLGRATLKNIHENLFWAFIYNIIGIPLAAGVYTKILGWSMNPMFGAAAMSLSSFFVVSNALRLNLLKVYDASKDRKSGFIDGFDIELSTKKTEETKMTKTMNIEGMMCEHCEARVKKTLEAIDGVNEAVVSHKEGTAVVSFEKEVSNDELKKAVEAQDYTVTSIV